MGKENEVEKDPDWSSQRLTFCPSTLGFLRFSLSNFMLNSALFNLIKDQFKLNLSSDHGIKHWDRQLEKLIFACQHHNNSRVKSADVTVQTCWDADSLDLGRVGIKPEPHLLNTFIAKRDETINFFFPANRL